MRPQKAANGTPNINEKTWYMISLKNLNRKQFSFQRPKLKSSRWTCRATAPTRENLFVSEVF